VKYVIGSVMFALGRVTRQSGWVVGPGVGYDCFADGEIRRADVSFHRLDRLTHEQATTEGHCTVVPDLVVEVVSPNDLAEDVNRKRREWLTAGARLVWVAYPDLQEVRAFTPDGTVRIFGPADALTADPVLPDFRTPVADLFRLPTTT
jgi:Uma2 family endonuclease